MRRCGWMERRKEEKRDNMVLFITSHANFPHTTHTYTHTHTVMTASFLLRLTGRVRGSASVCEHLVPVVLHVNTSIGLHDWPREVGGETGRQEGDLRVGGND